MLGYGPYSESHHEVTIWICKLAMGSARWKTWAGKMTVLGKSTCPIMFTWYNVSYIQGYKFKNYNPDDGKQPEKFGLNFLLIL